jgi:hypothetical protein
MQIGIESGVGDTMESIIMEWFFVILVVVAGAGVGYFVFLVIRGIYRLVKFSRLQKNKDKIKEKKIHAEKK